MNADEACPKCDGTGYPVPFMAPQGADEPDGCATCHATGYIIIPNESRVFAPDPVRAATVRRTLTDRIPHFNTSGEETT